MSLVTLLRSAFRPGITVVLTLALSWGAGASEMAGQSPKVIGWRDGCEKAQSKDCFELAKAFLKGRELLSRDPAEAARHYAKACELGRAEACQEYGEKLLLGEGVARDSATALTVLARGCELEPGSGLDHS